MALTYAQLRHAVMAETGIGYGPRNGLYTSSSRATGSVTLPALANALKPAAATEYLWIFLPEATGEDREKPAGSLTPATGVVQNVGTAYTGSESDPEAVELLRWISPTEFFDLTTKVLSKLPQTVLSPLGAFPDADMEAAGVSDWTRVNLDAGDSVKVSTASNVRTGRQALRTLLTSDGGYAAGGPVLVNPRQQCFASAQGYAADGTAVFTLWDVTHDVEVARVEYTGSRYADMQILTTIPAGCYTVEARLGGLVSGDDAYWDHVSGPWMLDTDLNIPAPTGLNEPWRFRKLRQASYGGQPLNGKRIYDARARRFHDWAQKDEVSFLAMHSDAHPYELQLRKAAPPASLWVEYQREAIDMLSGALTNDASGEAIVTSLPERYVIASVGVAVCDQIIADGKGDEGLRRAQVVLQNELAAIVASTPVESSLQRTEVLDTFSRI